jgi:hypothetical protein
LRTIARSIRDLALTESCGLGQDHGKGRTQINSNVLLYAILRQNPTTIYKKTVFFIGHIIKISKMPVLMECLIVQAVCAGFVPN